jgi:hypothetical protein
MVSELPFIVDTFFLLFLDPAFITHFLMTYRRFTTPRSILLAMQKRIRLLDTSTDSSGDPMFACFAQMRYFKLVTEQQHVFYGYGRICHLLCIWIADYPGDFAVRNTAGALSALIKSIISKTYLLHYGTDFLPFLELLPSCADLDSEWAVKVDDIADESDDSYSFIDEEEHHDEESSQETTPAPSQMGKRERKGSIPARALLPNSATALSSASTESVELSPKAQIKELQRLAGELDSYSTVTIAEEITKLQLLVFDQIEVSDFFFRKFHLYQTIV